MKPTRNALAIAYLDEYSSRRSGPVTFHYEPEPGYFLEPPADNGKALLEHTYELVKSGVLHDPPAVSLDHCVSRPAVNGYVTCEITASLPETSVRQLEAYTTLFAQLMGWERISAPFSEVITCYNCNETISESLRMGGRILTKDKAPEPPCKYQLCARCQREVCWGLLKRDKVQMALWDGADTEPFECRCKVCREEDRV